MKNTERKINQGEQKGKRERKFAPSADNDLTSKKEEVKPKKFQIKSGIGFILAITICTTAIFTSCSSPSQKVDNAKENATQTKEELNKAQEEYAADVEKFRKESDSKITANEKLIADFNAKMAKEKKQIKANYKEQIAALEQKNKNMKKRMDEYKADAKENWDSFKSEFNHDMDEMGKAIKDLAVKNTK